MEDKLANELIQIGIRTINPHQREQIDRFKIQTIEMKDILSDSDFDFINFIQGPLYISLDMDVLDPAFAPGVSHHEPGGLTTRQILKIFQKIETSHIEIIGADIVELNPKNDINSMTAMVAAKCLKEIIASMIS